jgi:hypothetical protein
MKFYKSKNIKTSSLIEFAKNSRTHSSDQVNQICESMKEFGFTNPVLVDEENTIIAGHGRVLAANKLELKEVPCIILDGLTDVQKRAYVIADNNIAINSGWDYDMLISELEDIGNSGFDINITGFSDFDIEALSFFGEDSEFDDGGNDDTSDRPDINQKTNLTIEFKPEDFEDAKKTYIKLKNKNVYVGKLILDMLKKVEEKDNGS